MKRAFEQAKTPLTAANLEPVVDTTEFEHMLEAEKRAQCAAFEAKVTQEHSRLARTEKSLRYAEANCEYACMQRDALAARLKNAQLIIESLHKELQDREAKWQKCLSDILDIAEAEEGGTNSDLYEVIKYRMDLEDDAVPEHHFQ